ncbi:TRAP transporter small permease subunit [Variovorax ginsengisoli]|uniref:TRAP transporter small permease protein n=1 Tax=Variovorax ginsengisoli TaxID=363844 RepID=A0ABT8S3U6_9BURK|nr:TRAP transporter small permease [Variovorax ginsengisoli]MDN8614245.1 TRAP transporter small permease [Variovorax ginsengisoli]MDO1533415.1 TRAP transporter small permease [Variovorax ginsengisoli]
MSSDRPSVAVSADRVTPAGRVDFKTRLETVLATVFGVIFLGLAVIVTIETLSRKLFNISLQGADELGGYALAVGSTIAFSLALIGRNHIRVDVFHEKFSPRVQALLNWISMLSLAVFALFIAWVAFKVIQDTTAYRSTAQTPWATPLIIPQSVWYGGLVIFALVACGLAWRATRLLLRGDIARLNSDFHPKSAKEELKEELDDLKVRQASEGAPS